MPNSEILGCHSSTIIFWKRFFNVTSFFFEFSWRSKSQTGYIKAPMMVSVNSYKALPFFLYLIFLTSNLIHHNIPVLHWLQVFQLQSAAASMRNSNCHTCVFTQADEWYGGSLTYEKTLRLKSCSHLNYLTLGSCFTVFVLLVILSCCAVISVLTYISFDDNNDI